MRSITLTLLLIEWFLLGIRAIRTLDITQVSIPSIDRTFNEVGSTYNHLLHLVRHTQPLNHLHVFHARQNLMLHLELCLHAEYCTLLDCEWLVLESIDSARLLQINNYVGSSFDFETEGEDDAFAWVAGVGDVFSGAKSQRLFPLAEGFVVLVWCCG